MGGYFDQADHRRLLAEYPIGEAFLAGPARLGRDELHDLQERRFAQVLARAWQVPFYARRWRLAGLEPGDVQGIDDLERLPSFSKADLMASIEAYPPFGDYHGREASPDWGMVMHTTSGTTGQPQPIFWGAWDREVQNALLARAYLLQGLRAEDVVHSVYGFGMVNGGHYIREALLHFTGALLLPAGTGIETRSEQQVALIRRFGATVLVGFIDYIKRLAEVAHELGIEPARDLAVRLVSGHIGQESREAVRALWGEVELYDWYGVGDTGIIAAEGPDHDGLYLWEDAHLVEIVEPETKRPLPEGERGNLCVTALFKNTIYPIVRFDTQDVSSILPGSGGLGIGFRRMAGFQGRSDNMVKLRGINVYPTAIGAHLAADPAAGGEYVCRVARSGNRDEMIVVVELASGVAPSEEIRARLRVLLRQGLGVEVGVELAEPGETAPFTGIESRQKPIRLIDARHS